MNEFETHTYTYLIDGIARYVGMSQKDDRAFGHAFTVTARSPWQKFLAASIAAGSRIELNIVFYPDQNLMHARDQALLAEGELITRYGRLNTGSGTLYNANDGSCLRTLLVNRVGNMALSAWLRSQATRAELQEAIDTSRTRCVGCLKRRGITNMDQYDAFRWSSQNP